MDKIFNKKNIIIGLCVLFALQIVIFLSLSLFSSKNVKERMSEKSLLDGLKKENISSLEIRDYQGSFTIEIKDDNYLVKTGDNSMPCDPEKIKNYLDMLLDLKQGIKRDNGTDPKSDLIYGLDRERSQDVIVRTKDKKEFVIHLGSHGSKQSSSYLRYNNEKIIREVDSDIADQTGNKPILWAQRKILSNINFEDVDSCVVDSKLDWYKGKYTLKFKEPQKKDKKAEAYVIDPPLNGDIKEFSFSNVIVGFIQLEVDDYKLNGGLAKENEEVAAVNIALKNNKSYKLTFYKPGPNDNGFYILAVDFNKYLYFLKQDQVKMLIKSTDDFIKKEEIKN